MFVPILVCKGGADEIEDEIKAGKAGKLLGLPKHLLKLPLGLKYRDLKSVIAKKFKMSDTEIFRMCYKIPYKNKSVVAEVSDQEDTEMLINEVNKTSVEDMVTLYVIVSPGSHD